MNFYTTWSLNEEMFYLVDGVEECNLIEIKFTDHKKYTREKKIEMIRAMLPVENELQVPAPDQIVGRNESI